MTNIIAGITKDLNAVPKKLKEKAKSADVKKLILLNGTVAEVPKNLMGSGRTLALHMYVLSDFPMCLPGTSVIRQHFYGEWQRAVMRLTR